MPYTVNSFDCARFSMGVAGLSFEPDMIDDLSKFKPPSDNIDDLLTYLEKKVIEISHILNTIIQVDLLTVWNLGDKVRDAWEVAPPLKKQLTKLDEELHLPDALVYEFQMDSNDKSRMVSTMVAYHYSEVAKTVRIAPAAKNKIVLAKNIDRATFLARCPKVAMKKIKNYKTNKLMTIVDQIFITNATKVDLNIQTFLKLVNDSYKANKLHTSASLEWWASLFGVDMSSIPKDCLDDAADAFIQVLAAYKARMFPLS